MHTQYTRGASGDHLVSVSLLIYCFVVISMAANMKEL